ncbi:hypothetical protein OEA41_004648 [Lepraria neglecta]|uniref:Uncharacterized protein n=1 Tax=Lepraria neglecta TaxID=209136 RepID=A0AAD9Z1F0_9LECA|nr:hypothetical protein OEA41_004648 [Lepraria neglecta]
MTAEERVMNQDIVDERKAKYTATAQQKELKKKEKEWDHKIKRLRTLGPDLFAPPRPPVTPRRRAPAPVLLPPATLLHPIIPPAKRQKKIVALRVRVTTQDLQQGRWAEHGKYGQQSSGELENQPMGRGHKKAPQG